MGDPADHSPPVKAHKLNRYLELSEHDNLAVVYLQTGRYKEAEAAVRSAERAGFQSTPAAHAGIKAKRG
jgi:hypothetical protein